MRANVNLSDLTAANDFSSPDGVWFDDSGLLWIQTDDGAYTDVTNCMMLAAVPGTVGDGSKPHHHQRRWHRDQDGRYVVAAPPGEARPASLPRRTKRVRDHGHGRDTRRQDALVNIQHPGEDTVPNFANPAGFCGSHWPDGGSARPRSATIVITKNDGGEVGGGLS